MGVDFHKVSFHNVQKPKVLHTTKLHTNEECLQTNLLGVEHKQSGGFNEKIMLVDRLDVNIVYFAEKECCICLYLPSVCKILIQFPGRPCLQMSNKRNNSCISIVTIDHFKASDILNAFVG